MFVLLLLALWHPGPAFGQGVLTTVAGTDWLFPGDGQPAVNAPLSASNGPDLAIDSQGVLYLLDLGNAMVMRVEPGGQITVIAGNGLVSDSGDGGPAVNASLYLPVAMAVDRGGAVYVVDSIGTIRKITTDGVIHTIAGSTGDTGFGGDGGPALNAKFDVPYGIAVDAAGNVYIADTDNHRIRKITTDGIIRTIAGTGVAGLSGDGGPATAARLLGPTRLALDGKGNIFFVDLSSSPLRGVVRKIDANGIITTVAGGGTRTVEGIPAAQSSLIALAVAVDAAGNLYVADRKTSNVLKVDASGILTTVAGSGVSGFGGDGGPALKAKFAFNGFPSLAVDPAGNIFVGDEGNGRVRKIDRAGTVTTYAGNGLFHFTGNGGPATSATLYLPSGLAQDQAGNIYVSEPTYGRIRRIQKDGTISVFAGNGTTGYSGDGGPATSASLSQPQGMAVAADGSLIFADTANCVVRRIDTRGVITTLVGTGQCGFSGDGGPATKAQLNGPGAVDVDGAGNLVITEGEGSRIRVVIGGQIATIAGNGTAGYSGDGGDSVRALVSEPTGVRIFGGYIYFGDSGSHVVRRIALDTTRKIETVAGNGAEGFSGDEGPATKASLSAPLGLTFDGAGNLYIADSGNARVRVVGRDGKIATIAGGGEYTLDGVPSTLALVTPFDVLMDSADNLLFTDIYFNRVRAVLAKVPSFQGTPKTIALTAPAGGQATEQTIQLTGSIAGVLFATESDSPWLLVSPEGGGMPASVTVRGDASKLAAGTYTGNVTIEAIAEPFVQKVPVSFTVTAAGQSSLASSPSSLQFAFVRGAAATRTRPISVLNAGGGSLPFTLRTTMNSGETWLKTSTAGGTVGAYGSSPVNVTADATGLAPGTYSATITILSSALGQQIIVPVTMTVSAVQQTILIPQTGLSFVATQGNGRGSVLPQFFSILNTGQGQMRWRVPPTTLSGGFWLSAFPTAGVTDAAQPLVPQIRVDIDPSGLAAGVYYGTIEVIAMDADNSPQSVSVVLTVAPPGAGLGAVVQPSGLSFAGTVGGEAPGSQTVLLQNTTGAPLTFTSGAVTFNNKPLFETLPSSGTLPASQPLKMLIQPKLTGLEVGIYRGTLTLSFADGSTRNISLALVIAPPGGASSPLKASKETTSSCAPKTLVPVFTQISDGFAIPASYPGQVSVKVLDDCSNPMVAGGVNVSFSNGDPPMRLTSLKDGTWAGTWTPLRQTSSMVVTASAAVPEQNLQGEVSVKGGLRSGNEPPVMSTGGIVNSASFGALALAPGSLVTVFGSKLADGQASATAVPLPTALGNASVLIAGREAPLLFTSDGQ